MSVGFLTLVAARAGCRVVPADPDRDSIDATVRPVKGEPVCIDVQLKCSSGLTRDGDDLIFDLPVNNYNDLRAETVGNARILVVLNLHDDDLRWLVCGDEALIVERMGYWIDLYGAPPTTNTTRKRVRLPVAQAFTPEGLVAMMQRRYHNIQNQIGGVQ